MPSGCCSCSYQYTRSSEVYNGTENDSVSLPYGLSSFGTKRKPLAFTSEVLKYQAILVEQEDVEIVLTNIVNPASFLSGTLDEPITHDCVETKETVYSSRPDLKEEPLEDAAESWYTDGSSFVKQGQRKAGYAIATTIATGNRIQTITPWDIHPESRDNCSYASAGTSSRKENKDLDRF